MKPINGYKYIILLVLVKFQTLACECPQTKRDTLVAEGLKKYDMVFYGEVISIDAISLRYKIKVTELFKGNCKESYINGVTNNSCSIFPKKGYWIIYANLEKKNSMYIDMCSSSIALSEIHPPKPKTADAVKQALSGATPEQMLALKTADQAFAMQMQALGFADTEKLAALAVENTKDARSMQVITRSNVPALLSVLITVGFFGILVGMLLGVLSATDNQALMIMLGALGAAWGAVINYFFGSSADSGRKTELLAQAPAVKIG